MTRNSGRQQLGEEGGGGGWQPRPKIRVAGKEENISGSLCGGRACNFGGKLKEAHFSLLPVSTMGFRKLFGHPKLIFKAWCLFVLPTSWAMKLQVSINKHSLKDVDVLQKVLI
jgi:hypothetical protein